MAPRLRRAPAAGIGRDDDSASSLRPTRDDYAATMPGQWELVLLALVLLLLFGARRVPQIGRQLGRGVRELKDGVGEIDPRDDLRRAMEAPEDEARAGGSDRRDESA
jgi:sec-independent protein translocase protein TatA